MQADELNPLWIVERDVGITNQGLVFAPGLLQCDLQPVVVGCGDHDAHRHFGQGAKDRLDGSGRVLLLYLPPHKVEQGMAAVAVLVQLRGARERDHAVVRARASASLPAELAVGAAGIHQRRGQPGALRPTLIQCITHKEHAIAPVQVLDQFTGNLDGIGC